LHGAFNKNKKKQDTWLLDHSDSFNVTTIKFVSFALVDELLGSLHNPKAKPLSSTSHLETLTST
jgi:hypothetical protein